VHDHVERFSRQQNLSGLLLITASLKDDVFDNLGSLEWIRWICAATGDRRETAAFQLVCNAAFDLTLNNELQIFVGRHALSDE
jgi:hypothetical protein